MSTFQPPVNPILFAFIDNGNTSGVALTAGSTYTGAIRNVTYFNKVTMTVVSDQAGTLYIHQYMNKSSPAVITTTVLYAGGGTPNVVNQSLSLPYYSIEYTNGGVDQVTFLVASKVSVFL